MEQKGNGSCLFSDDLRHPVAGKLQIIDHRKLLFFYLVDQIGNGPGAGLRI
jgi:hypothetical protein